jgi:mono/diheme cytochrome c family protein
MKRIERRDTVDEKQKQEYLEKYQQAKRKGVRFWPDIIYKDLLVAFAIFLLLVGLATFVGVASEPKADPSDSTYVPRPEWYFLFLFQLLKYFPGEVEWVGTTIIPTIAVLALFLLPFYDRNPRRYWKKRPLALILMTVLVAGIVALTILASATTPPQAETGTLAGTLVEKIAAGQDLYSIQCVECHGAEGEVTVIQGVEGLEGKVISAIHSKDVMYTRTDDTLFNIINYGQPDSGMPGLGKTYGGELSPGDIEAIVDFMRYTWDDRAELPKGAQQTGAIPTLGPGETPNYETHIQPIVKRYCASCHRAGKTNNNYLMGSYEEIMTSGDDTPNIRPGDLSSNIIRMLHRQEIEAGGPMPPALALKPELVAMFEQWVLAGAPKTAADVKAIGVEATAGPQTITPTLPGGETVHMTTIVPSKLVTAGTATPTPAVTNPVSPTPTPQSPSATIPTSAATVTTFPGVTPTPTPTPTPETPGPYPLPSTESTPYP